MSDKEKTQAEIKSEGERIAHTFETPGWELIEKMFKEEIMDLQSIKNIDDSDAESALTDMKARSAAVDKMMGWWRKIHGKVERKAFNESGSAEDSHIKHFSDED